MITLLTIIGGITVLFALIGFVTWIACEVADWFSEYKKLKERVEYLEEMHYGEDSQDNSGIVHSGLPV